MSTASEALESTLEARYREAVQINVKLQEQLDGAKADLTNAARTLELLGAELAATEAVLDATQAERSADITRATERVADLERENAALLNAFPEYGATVDDGEAALTEAQALITNLRTEKASHIELALHAEAASQMLLLALDRMLASAHPHPTEHPAMFAAWEAARLARDTAPAVLSTPADRAVMLHLVRLIQDSADVRYYVGCRGSQMRELLCAAITASGFKGDPAEALKPPEHRRDDEPRVKRLEREVERLERERS